MHQKTAIVCVTNNLLTDRRAHKHCKMLILKGYNVKLVGRNWPKIQMDNREYTFKRFHLLINKGPLFYAIYNVRLFFYLLTTPCHLVIANDLDTLLGSYLAGVLKKFKLIYDAHEYFTGVPEIQNKKWVKHIWCLLEKLILPNIHCCITVNQSIAQLYKQQYNKEFKVIHNIPMLSDFPTKQKSRKDLGLNEDDFIVILQGAGININRGAEELIESMQFTDPKVKLIILGAGDVWNNLQELVYKLNLSHKVKLINKLPYHEMIQYTYNANLGVSLDKPGNANYDNSLPNKLFDYLFCEIPVLASQLRELNRFIYRYEVGLTIPTIEPESIANGIHYFLYNTAFYLIAKQNTVKVKSELCWEKEYKQIEEWL
jgi:glycosyltransferase involved in cell wall biosynthesis